MTFWDFFNQHPIVGLLVCAMTLLVIAIAFEQLVMVTGRVLIAKYTAGSDDEEPTQPEGQGDG
jgi:hypothetical protein